MSTRVIALLLLLFPLMAGSAAQAQGGGAPAAGDPAAGKATWQGPTLLCRNCHGNDGEGAFGPDLAGRGLTLAQFRRVVRQPSGGGVMPSYPATSITDAEIADVHAYLTSLKPVAEPGPWRVPLPANAPLGQQIAIATVGCLQCRRRRLAGRSAWPEGHPKVHAYALGHRQLQRPRAGPVGKNDEQGRSRPGEHRCGADARRYAVALSEPDKARPT